MASGYLMVVALRVSETVFLYCMDFSDPIFPRWLGQEKGAKREHGEWCTAWTKQAGKSAAAPKPVLRFILTPGGPAVVACMKLYQDNDRLLSYSS